jgi:predicted nucleic acid-binding protein
MHAEELEVHLAEPYLRTGRVFAPTTTAWRRSGAIIASIRRSRGRMPDAALVNDVLLALSCREQGVTLVTRDRDLWQIEPHVRGLQLAVPFP